MRPVLLASLRVHARRYVAAAVAVVVAVGFVVVIGVLTAGARAGVMDQIGAPFRNADHLVVADPAQPPRGPACCLDTLDVAGAIALVDRLGADATGLGRVLLPARSANWRGETTVGPVADAEAFRWQTLTAGRFPAREGEAVLHLWDARDREIAIGDHLQVDGTDLEVVGLVLSPSPAAQASVYVSWSQYLRWRDDPTFHLGRVVVRGDVGPLPAGAMLYSPQRYVQEGVAELNGGTDTIALRALLFAGVALVVSVLVVANTFAILFAQRLRDFALLRCVGATRRQVLGSVRREAVVVGGLASVAGTVLGACAGYGLVPLINALAPTTPMGVPGLPWPWLLGGFAVGLVVTAVASWLPTRQVVRVSPLAALRPAAGLDPRTTAGRVRLASGALVLASGLVLLAVAVSSGREVFMVAGGTAVFAGILLSGPVLFPPLVRVTGLLLGRAGRLATANAVRDPRRTATTTAALLVGVTLTTAVLTGLASWNSGIDAYRDKRHPVDAAITSLDRPLPAGLLDRVRATPGVERAMTVDGAVAQVTGLGDPIPVVTAPHAAQVARDGGAFARVPPGTIHLDLGSFIDKSVRPGDRVTVRAGDRSTELRVISLSGWGNAGMVAPETLAQLTGSPTPQVLWVRAAPGVDAIPFVDALDQLADGAGADLADELQARALEDAELNTISWSVLGLLGVSTAIALIGIANTLGLSVLERARENALLRALGLTRGQLRRMLAAEAALLSVVAAVLGTAVGVGFAWVGFETFVAQALEEATLRVPWPQLGVVVVVAAGAGLLAAVVPARRAGRVAPAAGLNLD